jgi:hypothetical protein
VFPIEAPTLGDRESGKRPLTDSSLGLIHGKDQASTDPNLINAWWTRHPHAGVGIALDKSGLVVLDVDTGLKKDGTSKKGRESLAEFDAELSPTLTAITGSGGLHAVYDAGGAPIHALELREGIDIIGHGYIVAAPSPHYTGGTYRWNDIRAIAPVPEVLRRAVAAKRAAPSEKVQLVGTPIGEGGRNIALFRLGAALRDQGIGAEALARALDAENKQRCNPPLNDAELGLIVNSVLQRVEPSRDVAIGAVVQQEVQAMFAPRARAQRILDVAHQKELPVIFYKTGIEQFDTMSGGGFATRRVVGIVAPPSAGKSAFVTSVGLEMQKAIPILHFSTELPRKEVQVRWAAPIVGFPWRDGLKGLIPDDVIAAAVAPLNVWIIGSDDYDRNDPLGSLRTEALAIQAATGKAPLIIVDYIQMLVRDAGPDQIRHKVGALTLRLRMLAQELDCPILIVSSTGRAFYGGKQMDAIRATDDPSAYLAAAKESGEIEYDCGTIIFLDLDKRAAGQPKPCRAAVARCRDGEIGFVGLRAHLDTGLWIGDPSALAELGGEDRQQRKLQNDLETACKRMLEVVMRMPGRPWKEIQMASKMSFTLSTAARAKLLEDGLIEQAERGYDPLTRRRLKGDAYRVREQTAALNVVTEEGRS